MRRLVPQEVFVNVTLLVATVVAAGTLVAFISYGTYCVLQYNAAVLSKERALMNTVRYE